MCFNGPKMWQMGWYLDRHVTLTTGSLSWSGDLIGFVDYANTGTDKMIIRMDSTPADFYISFNRAIGVNEGTQEASNQIVVHSKTTGPNEYGASELVAKLAEGDSYDAAGTQILFNTLSTNNGIMRASVTIGDGNSPTPAPTSAPNPQPDGFRIKSALGDFCVATKNIDSEDEVVIGVCQSNSNFYWQYNEFGQVRNKSDTTKCLSKKGKKRLKLISCTLSGTIPSKELFGYNAWDRTLFWKKRHLVITIGGGFEEGKKLKIRRAKYPIQDNQVWMID